jgi:hypothetical protein
VSIDDHRAITRALIAELRALPEGVLAALAEAMKLSKDRTLSRFGWTFFYLAEDFESGAEISNFRHICLWGDLYFGGYDKEFVARLEEAEQAPWAAVLAAIRAVDEENRAA